MGTAGSSFRADTPSGRWRALRSVTGSSVPRLPSCGNASSGRIVLMAVSRRPQAQVGLALTGERVLMFRKPHGCGGYGAGQVGRRLHQRGLQCAGAPGQPATPT